MIVKPGKLQAMIIDKRKRNHLNETMEIKNKTAEAVRVVKLLGVTTDDNLNVHLHISSLWRFVDNQLNALIRLQNLLGFEEKKVLINSFFY